MEIWDLWYPNAGAQGLSFCRARLDPTDELLVHAAPDVLRVDVRGDDGELLASGDQLRLAGEYFPMTRLRREGARIVREDGWPTPRDNMMARCDRNTASEIECVTNMTVIADRCQSA